ncbi:FkbM family methyltransferase [Tautonia plasticadhaerens]|uniref:Methyltransferase FkbM domain-containing protein n=1 Tax=Tautonia plasticadhaerens TaxID=2527974 RepID=A0A518HFM9_9BACT|nr:FkbM family methyltransferase [Tautonia plasticadhaerens]QDV39647.1 hypothetical protein ElP_76190 [Tautonia plasticadhaerens]
MSYPRLPFLFLPVMRAELPGWGWLCQKLRLTSPAHNYRWKDAPVVTMRGKWHGYLMELRLSYWSDRLTYFLGRSIELEVPLAMRRLLRPGDLFIDIGANIGMIMLQGSQLVGPSGRVICFEPNPTCLDRLRRLASSNDLETLMVHPMALGSRDDTLKLTVIDDDPGMGTLAGEGIPADRISASYEVPVRRGDDVLAGLDRPPAVIKLDVEGFELEALQGLDQTLASHRPAVLMEYHADSLIRAGASQSKVVAFFEERGYLGYAMSTRRRMRRHRLVLTPISAEETGPTNCDALWIHRDDPRRDRIALLIARR